MKKNLISSILALSAIFAVTTTAIGFENPVNPTSIKLDNPPTLQNADSFSIIMLGDPQTYIKNSFSQPLFELMTAWTAAHKNQLKIKTVVCTGDLVERNETATRFPQTTKYNNGNTPSSDMWESVARAFSRLDNELPYVLCTGNHDYGYENSENRCTNFDKYFPVAKNKLWLDCLVAVFPNAEGRSSLENAAYEFHDKNWGDILIISLEFAPRDETIEWAKKVTQKPQYKNHKIIILTHSVLRTKGKSVSIYEKEGYKLQPRNWGAALLKKLVFNSQNIKLVLCGHSGDPSRMSSHLYYEKSNGVKIPIVMFNPQAQGGWDGNGGDGWLRIMEFMPDGKTISMRTYSPLFAASAQTHHLSWNRDSDNEFKIEIQ